MRYLFVHSLILHIKYICSDLSILYASNTFVYCWHLYFWDLNLWTAAVYKATCLFFFLKKSVCISSFLVCFRSVKVIFFLPLFSFFLLGLASWLFFLFWILAPAEENGLKTFYLIPLWEKEINSFFSLVFSAAVFFLIASFSAGLSSLWFHSLLWLLGFGSISSWALWLQNFQISHLVFLFFLFPASSQHCCLIGSCVVLAMGEGQEKSRSKKHRGS